MEYNVPIKRVLISQEQIQKRAAELGEQISKDYAGKAPVIVGILRGSILFFADLVRNIKIDCSFDFMSLSSYNGGTSSSGKVRLNLDLREDIKGKDVIIVEDIVDTGYTLEYIRKYVNDMHPKSLVECTLLDKKARRVVEIEPTYSGFVIEDLFVVGYGLDYDQKYRNLPYIGVVVKE
jgi:hypoxanthine phosphoribosyltransferase